MMKATFHEDALADMLEAARFYEERLLDLGWAFIETVEEGVNEVLDNPRACQLVGDEVRQKILRRFPYSVIYTIESDRIRILAVAHHRRRPEYWRHRA